MQQPRLSPISKPNSKEFCIWHTTTKTNHIKAKKAIQIQSKTCLKAIYMLDAFTTTYYLAESLSWYSLEREKHSWTPLSTQSLFIPARSSSEKGSVSSILDTTSMTIFASPWKEEKLVKIELFLKWHHYEEMLDIKNENRCRLFYAAICTFCTA